MLLRTLPTPLLTDTLRTPKSSKLSIHLINLVRLYSVPVHNKCCVKAFFLMEGKSQQSDHSLMSKHSMSVVRKNTFFTGRETQEDHTRQDYGIPVWKKKSWGAEACINLTCCYILSSKFKHETRKIQA